MTTCRYFSSKIKKPAFKLANRATFAIGKDTVTVSHGAIFLATCNAILLLRDVNQ